MSFTTRMRGWVAALLGVALLLEGCASTLDVVRIGGGGGPVAAVPRPEPAARSSRGTNVEPAARSAPARAFPYDIAIESIPTPVNHDATRSGAKVAYIVVHYTVISYERTLRAFNNPRSGVSANYVIRGDGKVAEVVSPDDVAWHSGNAWMNDRSVGIELELSAETNPAFTETQYQVGARLTCALSERYGIPIDRKNIIGHVEVPGSTHTDPGPTWDWPRFMWYVKLCAPANASTVKAAFVAQSPFLSVDAGSVGTVQVRLRNTGATTWRKGTKTEARIAIRDDSDAYASLAKDWLAPDRPAAQDEAVVAPGDSATFTFEVRATRPGRYTIPLRGVIDGAAWMNDLGMYTVVTVNEARTEPPSDRGASRASGRRAGD